jgi:hypothetical protein
LAPTATLTEQRIPNLHKRPKPASTSGNMLAALEYLGRMLGTNQLNMAFRVVAL